MPFETKRFNLKTTSDFEDFCGDIELKFDLDSLLVDDFVDSISKGMSYPELLAKLDNNVDELAKIAVFSFSQGLISREQASSILEFRAMKNYFPAVTTSSFFDEGGQLTSKAASLLPRFMSSEDQIKFLEILKTKPLSESCFFVVTIPDEDLQNPGIAGLLGLAAQMKIITKSPLPTIKRFGFEEAKTKKAKKNTTFVASLSVGARDALTKAIYGEHAKGLLPRLGSFTKDDIYRSMMNNCRYSATSYPGISDTDSFHQVTASPFYLTLHDEVHRRLISTIPNPSYDSLLYAIDIVREKTGLHWSREIWNCLDMEIGEFLNETSYLRDNSTPEVMTQSFVKLLSANILTQDKPVWLFTDSAFCDTTWLLMVDIALNSETWKERSIDPHLFPKDSEYFKMFQFIEMHKAELEQVTSPAKQIAWIKSKYFDLPYVETDEYTFRKSKDNYISLLHDDKPILLSKNETILVSSGIKGLDLEGVINFIVDNQSRIPFSQEEKLNLLDLVKKEIVSIYALLLASTKIQYLKEPSMLQLITNRKISMIQLSSLSNYQVHMIEKRGLASLVNDEKLSIEQIITLPDHILQDELVVALFKNDKLSFNQLIELSPIKLKLLSDKIIFQLVNSDKITIEQLEKLSDQEVDFLKSKELISLIESEKLTADELQNIPHEKISDLSDYYINSLMRNNYFGFKQYKDLSSELIHYLKQPIIAALFFEQKLTFDAFTRLPPKIVELLSVRNIGELVAENKLTIDELGELSSDVVTALKDEKIYKSILNEGKTIEELKTSLSEKEADKEKIGFFAKKRESASTAPIIENNTPNSDIDPTSSG